MNRLTDLQRTEHYLLDQPGVMKASVWMRGGLLIAQVSGDAPLDPSLIRNACVVRFGENHSPAEIKVG